MSKLFFCPFCSFKSNHKFSLRRHVRNKHYVKCPFCQFAGQNYVALRSHFSSVHTASDDLVRSVNSIGEYERVCDLTCGEVPNELQEKLVLLFQNDPHDTIANCRDRTIERLKPLCRGIAVLEEEIEDREMDLMLNKLADYHCRICFTGLFSASEQYQHMLDAHPESVPPVQKGFGVSQREHTRRREFQVFEIDGADMTPVNYLHVVQNQAMNLIKRSAHELGGIKWALVLNVTMVRPGPDGEDVVNVPFRSKMQFNLSPDDAEFLIAAQEILHSIDEFQMRGSNWIAVRVHEATIEIAKANPPGIAASSYLPTPPGIFGIVNVENQDLCCFKYAVLASLHHNQVAPHAKCIPSSYREFESIYDWSCLSFPVALDEIRIFERRNNISINVYLFDLEGVYPCRMSKFKGDHLANLLLLYDKKKCDSHYLSIIDMAELLFPYDRNKKFVCPSCLSGLRTEAAKDNHLERCLKSEPVCIKMNKPGSVLEFKEAFKTLRAPYVVYGDFESMLIKIAGCIVDPDRSSTTKTAQHVPFAVSAVLLGPDGVVDSYFSMDPDHVVTEFLHCLDGWAERVHELTHEKIIMTLNDWNAFNRAEVCYLCKKPFLEDRKKCRDHCVATGKFRGAACGVCNLLFKITKKLPVFFHNLENYDGHFLVKAMAELGKQIQIIPRTYEKYISVQYKHRVGTTTNNKAINMNIMFIDSFHHLSASLSTLAANLHQHKLTSQLSQHEMLRSGSVDLIGKIVTRKLPFCYEYIDSYAKLNEKELPPKEAFYSDVTLDSITDEDYSFLEQLWKQLKLTSLQQFLHLYVLVDTFLLADVFEEYRDVSLKNYSLDPAHFITSPSLAWSAALKMTQVKLELLTDIDMQLLFEELRGGVSMITKRFARANNESVNYYDKTRQKSYILDLDINSLYPSCMIMPLPMSNFEWIDPSEFPNLNDLDPDGQFGYVVECDLFYDKDLHDRDNDLPLMPEKIVITRGMESSYGKELGDFFGRSTLPRLSPNFFPKFKYPVHSTTLQYYCSRGIQIIKIHRVIRFKQAPWLRPFILKNIDLRKKATSKFEKDTYKLFSNAVYGKSCESLRNRQNIKLFSDLTKAESMVFAPEFVGFRIFDENLVAIKLLKRSVTMNRPIYLGFTILEYAKRKLYQTYDELKDLFPTMELLATDTDSFIVLVYHPDPYNVLCHHIDCSNFPPDHPCFSEDRKQHLGLLKDEKAGVIIEEYCGLRSKVYSIKDVNQKEEKRCKGISRSVVKRAMAHVLYVGALFGKHSWSAMQTLIQNRKHEIFTMSSRKLALVPYDNKRYILSDGVHTRAYGHYKNV